MSDGAGELAGFAYGEDLEDGSGRSLGYRLLAPARPQPWCGEVEGLARRLQAAPYSDHWPPTDLFCSALLADGRRLVAVASYGLSDHTPSHRRGGLEMVGVVGPGELGVQDALALYRWLRRRRAECEDLHSLGGTFPLADVLAQAPPASAPDCRPEGWEGPVPVLPVRLGQDGAFLFAASTPSDPDHHLRLLDEGAGPGWQWLPLVGPDFPLSAYAQRGPLIAWTPHLAGVALRLERKPPETGPVATRAPRAGGARLLLGLVVAVLVALLAGNLWYLRAIDRRLAAPPVPAEPPPTRPVRPAEDPGRARFVGALGRLLAEGGAAREWGGRRPALLRSYEEVAERYPDLRLPASDPRGREAVGLVAVLAGRTAGRIEGEVRRALAAGGFSDRLIDTACAHVRARFAPP